MDNARTAWELSGVRPFLLGALRSPAALAGRRGSPLLRLPRWIVLALTLLFFSARVASAATPEQSLRAAAILDAAEKADAELAFARALAGYEEGLRLDPSTSRALRAETRAAILRARSEGNFEPLVKLERVRRDPALASNDAAIDELARDATSWPPGLVRIEAWTLAAEAYANRLGRPDDADRLLRLILRDPSTETSTARKAARDLVTIALATGDLGAAESAVALAGARADDKLARDVARVVRRRKLHASAVATLVILGVLAAAAFVRAARAGRLATVAAAARRMSRLAIAYAAYVAIAGALLASGYEEGTAKPFLYFGVALVPLLLVARAWAAAGSTKSAARAARAGICAAAAMAAAFLVLEKVDVSFLESLGL